MPLNGPALGHLQILLVEDSAEDAELICDMLEQAGVAASFQRVDDEDGLVEVLSSGRCDIVLSDLSMPGFCGMRALELVRGLTGKTVLLVLHDLTLALRYCDRLAVLEQGRLAAFDTPQAVLRSGTLDRVFGVTAHETDFGCCFTPGKG